MEVSDFKGISYFRFFVPIIFIVSWTSMILGPEFITIPYRQFGMLIYVYFFLKTTYQLVLMINTVLKGNAALERAKSQDKQLRPLGIHYHDVYHAFSIPSYKEDIELLAETLETLAQHQRAPSTYLIFLAMEHHEEGSDVKAQQLIARFQNKFRYIDFTRHKVRQFEQKGKASNVSWCVESMEEKFKTLMISTQDVFVTVMDADSWAPNAYFNEVQDHIYKNFDDRKTFIYQPTQIFSRNNMDVPVFVRTYDDMFASFHAASIAACCGPTFSFSNYTLSYDLVKKIGFWDTVQEAIAEDFHMCLKAYFKTNGEVKGVPIYTPFNQLNIQTGNGYVEDVKAKFWQLERHGRALLDMGYCWLMFFKYSFNVKSLLLIFVVMQNFLMPIVIPCAMFSILIQDRILKWEAPEGILAPINFFILFNLTNLFGVILCLLYDYYKRKSSKILYGIQNPSILRIVEGPILIALNAVVVLTVSYVISSFSGLKKNREYVVADKNFTPSSTSSLTNFKVQSGQQTKAQVVPSQQEKSKLLPVH